MNKPLSILIISDGKPGHVNQARGMVTWIKSHRACEDIEVDVRIKAKGLTRSLAAYLLNTGSVFGAKLVKSFYTWPDVIDKKPDIIVSAGGNTSFLTAALARLWQCKSIFLGSLRKLKANNFSCVCTLESVGSSNNLILDFPPTMMDPDRVCEQGNSIKPSLGINTQPVWTMVIGGAGAGFQYTAADWKTLAEAMNTLANRHKILWCITTSRRTGVDGELALQKYLDSSVIAKATYYGHKPEKVMAAYLGVADQCFVTGDSMSMIAECISSGKPTVVLHPEQARPDHRFAEAVDKMVSNKLIRCQNFNQLESFSSIAKNDSEMDFYAYRKSMVEKLFTFL